jgi:hypothetical protein
MIPLSAASAILMVFAALLANPGDGPMGEEPDRRRFASLSHSQPSSRRWCLPSPPVVVSSWHMPILFLKEVGLQTSF